MDSVQNQTWPNLVHVVLDNNSTDGTARIIENYRDAAIPVLAFRNDTTVPIKENWNAAFERVPAAAVYTKLLCADDTLYPDAVAEMVALAETDPEIGVVGCLHDCMGDVADFFWPKDQTVFDSRDAVRKILLREGVLMPVQLLMRKSVTDHRTPLFQPPVPGGYDMDAMLELITRSKFGFVHKSLCFTRVHENTVTNTTFGSREKTWTADALYFLTTYGPAALGENYEDELKRFRRYYVRRMLLWRRQGMSEAHQKRHFEAFREAGWSWGPALIADAIIDWALIKAGVRRNWTGYPGWQ